MKRVLGRLHHDRNLDPATLLDPIGLERLSESPQPQISIVLSTFNRPDTLMLAIDSVLAQTLSDFELLVIGDCCSEETARAVESLDDPRIFYLNLNKNIGDQSGPNSIGARISRGKFIAFLNHDDLYYPNHLQDALIASYEHGADFICGQWARPIVVGLGANGQIVMAACQDSSRKPTEFTDFYPASTFFLRSDLARKLGDWKSPFTLRAESSRDYLFRAWGLGAKIRALGSPSVMICFSAEVANSYRNASKVHDLLSRASAGKRFFELPVMAKPREPRILWLVRKRRNLGWNGIVSHLLVGAFWRPLALLGTSRNELLLSLRGVKKGNQIENLRVRRGLQ